MWPQASGRTSTSRSSAPRPASASRPTEARSRPLRQPLRPLRRAGRRRRPGRPRRGAWRRPRPAQRVILCDEQARVRRRAALRARRARSTASAGYDWAQATLAEARRHAPMSRVLPRTTAFGYYAQNFVGLVERVTDHLARPGRRPAARAAVAGARQAGRARDRRDRAPAGVRRQRPAGHHAGLGGAHLSSTTTASPSGRKVGVYTASDSAYARGLRPEAGRRRDRRHRRLPRDDPDAAAGRRGARPRHRRSRPATPLRRPRGRLRVTSMTVAAVNGTAAARRTIAIDCAADVGRLDALGAPVLAVARQARLRRGQRPLPARHRRAGLRLASAPATAPDGLPPRSTKRCGRREARRRPAHAASREPKADAADGWAGGMLGAAPGAGPEHDGQGLRRLPERRHRQGHPPRGARGHALDRARQALHHQRHGDRPGQDVEHERPCHRRRGARTSRSPRSGSPPSARPIRRSPSAPSSTTRAGELFDPTRTHADPRLGARPTARCSRMSASGSAPGISRAAARTCTRRSTANAATVRKAAGIFDASTLGKIEVVGPDAAKFMNRIYTNPWDKLEPGRCRYGLMLREDGFIYDDGVIGRLAADRFHVTTTTGGAPRVLNMMEDYLQTECPHLEGLADLDHRAMGGHRRAGAEGARDHRAARRGHRPVRRGLAAHVGARGQDLRRADAAVPRLLHRRARLRDQRAGRLRPGRVGGALASAASRWASRPTAPRRCTCCAPRRATSSSARTPTAR